MTDDSTTMNRRPTEQSAKEESVSVLREWALGYEGNDEEKREQIDAIADFIERTSDDEIEEGESATDVPTIDEVAEQMPRYETVWVIAEEKDGEIVPSGVVRGTEDDAERASQHMPPDFVLGSTTLFDWREDE